MIIQTLPNGMKVVISRRENTPLAVCSVTYKVGSRNEQKPKTGMAHFMEHLMFEGTEKYPSYDEAIHLLSGENNAFTSNDYTTYYAIVPAANIVEAIKIEADRMQHLNISKKKFNNQKNVVIEEFKETHLDQPYGTSWHHLSEMMYEGHPYEWPVIGAKISDIEHTSLEDIMIFYKQYYHPSNAVISIVGNIDEKQILKDLKDLFTETSKQEIPMYSSKKIEKSLIKKSIIEPIPSEAFWIAYETPARFDADYYKADMICDVLGNGESSRIIQKIQKELSLVTEIDTYMTASIDTGMLVIEGKANEGVSLDSIYEEIEKIIVAFCQEKLSEKELQKVQNKANSYGHFNNYQLVNFANNLSYYEAFDSALNLSKQSEFYNTVTVDNLHEYTKRFFEGRKCVLDYRIA
jgi:zinc protease